MSKYKTFRGGYRFKNFQGQPDDVLENVPIPLQVKIPLWQGFGAEVDCLVKAGDKVSAGQIIGRSEQNVSSPVHATINGTVRNIIRSNYLDQSCLIVSIDGDGSSEYQKIPDASSNWRQLSTDQIEDILYTSGVSALGYEGIPTRFNSSIIQPGDVENVIVQMIGSEPYNLSPRILLQDKKILVEGLQILHKVMPGANFHLALDNNHKRILQEVSEEFIKYEQNLKPKFPQNHKAILVKTVLGKRFPYGYSAANIGVVILDLQSVLQVYEAVVEGKPLIERTIALCGTALKKPLHIKARIGTILNDLIGSRMKDDIPARFVLNSLLSGMALDDLLLPIDRTYSQIMAIHENRDREFLAFIRPGSRRDSYSHTFMSSFLPEVQRTCDTNRHGEERPCISCNYCEEVCPVNIIPHILSKYVQRSIIDETLANLHIFDCIQCGLCSYVCPSKIPLAQHIKEGTEMLSEQGCTRDQCILHYFDNIKGETRL